MEKTNKWKVSQMSLESALAIVEKVYRRSTETTSLEYM